MPTIFKNHPELVANLPEDQGLIDFIDGRVCAVEKYLTPYTTEMGNSEGARNALNARRERLYNINDCEPYLFLHLGHLAQDITLTLPETETFDLIKSDVSGFGESAEQMARQMVWYGLGEGRCGVLVDRPKSSAKTALEAKQSKERSYQVFFRALEIRDWERFESGPKMGKLKKVILDAKPRKDGKDSYARFRTYELESENSFVEYALIENLKPGDAKIDEQSIFECKDIERFPLELSEIPFEIFGEGPSDSYLAKVWPLNKALLNLGSVKSSCNHNQGFQRTFAFGAKPEEIQNVGEYLISLVQNENASISTIDPGNPASLENEESLIRRRLDRIAKIEFNQLSDDTRQVQSAESKAKDLKARIGIYNDTMDMLTDSLKTIYQLHATFEGDDPEKIEVTISRDYGLEDEAAEVREMESVFAEARELGAVDVQKAILRTRIQRLKLIPKADQTREQLLEELDASVDSSGQVGTRATDTGGFLDGVFSQ